MIKFSRHFLLFICVVALEQAFACSCVERNPQELWDQVEHVFIAEITDVETADGPGMYDRRAQFELVRRLKGDPGQVEALLGTQYPGAANCLLRYEVGERFMILANDDGEVNWCSGSGRVGSAPGTVAAYFESLNLARLLAIRDDAQGDCAYSQVGQVEKLDELANAASSEEENAAWRVHRMHAEERYFLLRNLQGQELKVRYGGCQDIGMTLELRPVVSDLELYEKLGIARRLAEEFWQPGLADRWQEQVFDSGEDLGDQDFMTFAVGDSTVIVHHKRSEQSLVVGLQHHY